MARTQHTIDQELRLVLKNFPQVQHAILFGSVAAGLARPDSDLDIAVRTQKALTLNEKMALIASLAIQTGRPIDLIDLRHTAEPLLGQILQHGRRLLGSDSAYAQLITRHVVNQADFVPYRDRILSERRSAWIGS